MEKNLIFDIGFYNGDSSKHFLQQGCNVVGVDCNPFAIRLSKKLYKEYIEKNQLTIVDKCIASESGEKKSFYVAQGERVWSSTHKDIATRVRECCEITVETISINDLIKTYGTPIYCKIDVEGDDIIVLESLKNVEVKPLFISCETECIGNENHLNVDGLDVINKLKEIGYIKFFLHKNAHDETFEFNCDVNQYQWFDYKSICQQLIEEREKHDFSNGSWTFWWDVYATF